MSQLINGKYFKSKDVHVFPASFRGNYQIESGDYVGESYQFDPEARLYTEHNYLTSGKQDSSSISSYIISWKITDNVNNLGKLCCVIGGYYFEITNVSLNDLATSVDSHDPTHRKSKHLYIRTRTVELKADTDSQYGAGDIDSARSTEVLTT